MFSFQSTPLKQLVWETKKEKLAFDLLFVQCYFRYGA